MIIKIVRYVIFTVLQAYDMAHEVHNPEIIQLQQYPTYLTDVQVTCHKIQLL